VDVVGSDALVYEAELVQIYDEVFTRLGLPVVIKINHRKILAGIAEVAGIPDLMTEMTVAIDKLDKIGKEGVREEMIERGIPANAIQRIEKFLEAQDLEALAPQLQGNPNGATGIRELQSVLAYLEGNPLSQSLKFDVTLARGLNYYTGCIFEVQAANAQMGSLGGGGRYDNLTGVFGLEGFSGVGISFGAERIYDVMEELGLFPAGTSGALKVLFVAFDAPTHHYAFKCLGKVRMAGISAEIYPEPVKLKKQLKYANDRKVPYVVLAGETEMLQSTLTLKDMVSGEQVSLSLDALIQKLGV
jgi:histidyl-tRNA synthetase